MEKLTFVKKDETGLIVEQRTISVSLSDARFVTPLIIGAGWTLHRCQSPKHYDADVETFKKFCDN